MRKLILAISVMTMPLAACGTEETAPPEPDPTGQVIAEPAPAPDEQPAGAEPETDSATETESEAATE